MAKKKPKGKCRACGKSPRVLTKIESGQRICRTCLREIRGPQRPKYLATPSQIASLREQGLSVPDDLPKAEYHRLSEMTTLRERGVAFDPSASLEELKKLERETYVNQRSSRVEGVSFPNADGTNRQEIISRCSDGELLLLKHVNDNPKYGNALAVVRRNGERIGYLSQEDAADVLKNLAQGWQYEVIINKILDDGIRGHYLGVSIKLVYAHPSADRAIIENRLASLAARYSQKDSFQAAAERWAKEPTGCLLLVMAIGSFLSGVLLFASL